LQINDWFIFVVYTLFTLAVIVTGIPFFIQSLKTGIRNFKQYGFKKAPIEIQRELKIQGYDTGYAVEPILIGLFLGGFATWYLLISKYNLLNYFEQVLLFFKL